MKLIKKHYVCAEMRGKAIRIGYEDEFGFCRKVVKALMAVSKPEKVLRAQEQELLAVMCGMCSRGQDYNKWLEVDLQCRRDGVCIGGGRRVMRNYKSKMKDRGWVVGKELNPVLAKAAKEKRLELGLYLQKR